MTPALGSPEAAFFEEGIGIKDAVTPATPPPSANGTSEPSPTSKIAPEEKTTPGKEATTEEPLPPSEAPDGTEGAAAEADPAGKTAVGAMADPKGEITPEEWFKLLEKN